MVAHLVTVSWLVLLFDYCLAVPTGGPSSSPAEASTSAPSPSAGAACGIGHAAYLAKPLREGECGGFDWLRKKKSGDLNYHELSEETDRMRQAEALRSPEERRRALDHGLVPQATRDQHQRELQDTLDKITPPSTHDGTHSLAPEQVDHKVQKQAKSLFRKLQGDEGDRQDWRHLPGRDLHAEGVSLEKNLRTYYQTANKITASPDKAPPGWTAHISKLYHGLRPQGALDPLQPPRPQQDRQWASNVDQYMSRGREETPAARELWALHAGRMMEANKAKNEAFRRAHFAYRQSRAIFPSEDPAYVAATKDYANHAAMEDVHAMICRNVPHNLAAGTTQRQCGDLSSQRERADRAAQDQVRSDVRHMMMDKYEDKLEARRKELAERDAREASVTRRLPAHFRGKGEQRGKREAQMNALRQMRRLH